MSMLIASSTRTLTSAEKTKKTRYSWYTWDMFWNDDNHRTCRYRNDETTCGWNGFECARTDGAVNNQCQNRYLVWSMLFTGKAFTFIRYKSYTTNFICNLCMHECKSQPSKSSLALSLSRIHRSLRASSRSRCSLERRSDSYVSLL